jgi:hypothetical protein
LFFQVDPGGLGLLARASLGIGAFAETASVSSDVGAFRMWLVGGRLRACPIWFGGTRVHVAPCASVDLGTIQTAKGGSTGRSSGDFWAAVAAGLRLEVPIGGRFVLDARAGAEVPLTRYELVALGPERSLYRTAPVGFVGGVGGYFVLP